DFSSKQTSGIGGTPLNFQSLGVETDDTVPIGEVVFNNAGRNRVRLDYWKVEGSGVTAAGSSINFAGNTYPMLDDIKTTVELESIGIFWEPAVLMTDNLRLRLVAGANLIRFKMGISEILGPQSSEVTVPGDEGTVGGLAYVPVPLLGACVEVAFYRWLKLYGRGQLFDVGWLSSSDDVDGTIISAVGGLLFTLDTPYRFPRRLSLLLGYRHFGADYSYEEDMGDSTLGGFVMTLGFVF
ncbi:MAG: hypothetical protein ACYSU0_14270, partial [Planctomycetota bacterium]